MTYAILTLTNARIELGASVLERHISAALSISDSNKVTVVLEDDDSSSVTIILYPEDDNEDAPVDAELTATKLNEMIQSGEASGFANLDSTCEPADEEEEVSIEEEDAYELWHSIPDEERTSHLDEIPNPDGVMIRPSHGAVGFTEHHRTVSPCEAQMRRDPSLLSFDNVDRIDVAEIHTISWDKPVIITNAVPETFSISIFDKQRLKDVYGHVQVRTGNRETLIENGFTNSKPMSLSDALGTSQQNDAISTECGTIVFSPVKELPDDFITELTPLMHAFPCEDADSPISKKFTLTIASEPGFGIGMHKHNAALFMLLVGKKKWYMTASEDLEGVVDTHPGFYRELSSHKCIQQAGEVLFVPNEWYHEIFNLEYTVGIQALPE